MSSPLEDAFRSFRNLESQLSGLQPALENAQRMADVMAEAASPAIDAALRAIAANQAHSGPQWTNALISQAAEIAGAIDQSGLAGVIERIQKDFGPALEQFRLHSVASIETASGSITNGAQSATHNAGWQRLCQLLAEPGVCPPPSPQLERWIDLGQREIEPDGEKDLPAIEEVHAHWLAALLWVLVLSAIFSSAARFAQWSLAYDVLGALADATSIFLGLDWLMTKVMK